MASLLWPGARRSKIEGVADAGAVLEREDVDAVLAALMDIRAELHRIRTLLGENDGEETEDTDHA